MVFEPHFNHAMEMTAVYLPVSILRKSISGRHRPVRVADGPMTESISGRHRPVRVADGPMTARCRFT